jgi:DNA invertase Pin-like site-specific DNA recombinase
VPCYSFQDDGPTAKLVRQVLGAVAEFDKPMTVAKLRGARERKRKTGRPRCSTGALASVKAAQRQDRALTTTA